MPKPKANTNLYTHPGVWCSYITDEFIAARPEDSLPRSWGRNTTQRYTSAAFIAYISVNPSEVVLAPEVFGTTAHLHSHFAKQAWFATLYASAPGIVSTVHDELIVETPVASAENVQKLVSSSMIEAMESFFPQVPIKVDAKICRHWGEK